MPPTLKTMGLPTKNNDRTSDDQYVAYATYSVENRTHIAGTDSERMAVLEGFNRATRDPMFVLPLSIANFFVAPIFRLAFS